MASLNSFPNETGKSQELQNQQVFIALQQIQSWSNSILSQQDVNYRQNNNTNNVKSNNQTTNSNTYVNMQDLTFNFTPKNPLCLLNINMTLKGLGFIGVLINGQLLEEIPFANNSFNQVSFVAMEKFLTSSNRIQMIWKATSGTLEYATSKAQPFLNLIQITDFNN